MTSSSTALGGIYTGAGPLHGGVDGVLGVLKAYMTRVGRGPFPTEMVGEEGKELQRLGREFGATTGRPRRCGWMDLPLLRYAALASRSTSLALAKIDVLGRLKTLKVCYAYRYKGQIIQQTYPELDLTKAVPLFKEMEPFHDRLHEGGRPSAALRAYIGEIEKAAGCPVGILSYGPGRKESLFLKEYF